MTVLLMLCMIVTFLAADKIVRTVRVARERRLTERAGSALAAPPEGISLALNHTWMSTERNVAVIGTDEFLARMLGAVDAFVLPHPGTIVAPGSPDITLERGGRKVRLASPVAGRILEVNTGVLRDPALARRDPYGSGWLLKVSPDPARRSALALLQGPAARRWLSEQMSLAKEFLSVTHSGASPAMLQDGGEVSEGALMHCESAAWVEFERRFLTLSAPETVAA
jgi:glycine cleavage system H protein